MALKIVIESKARQSVAPFGDCRAALLIAVTVSGLLAFPAQAQDEMPDKDDAAPAATAPAVAKPAAETSSPQTAAAPAGTMTDMNTAELQALDKITARVSKLEVRVGETATFGTLSLTVKACRKAPPEDSPESAAFVQVWEQKKGEEPKWDYSGWMFASSPGIAAMDHPVYDIWVLDCKNAATDEASPAAPKSAP